MLLFGKQQRLAGTIWEMLEYLRLAYENTENMCEMRREGRTVDCYHA